MEITIWVSQNLTERRCRWDENKFLFCSEPDLAVGAPNTESVYVYRGYPIVKIITNVYPSMKELRVADTNFKFKFCWSLQSKTVDQTSKEEYVRDNEHLTTEIL